MGFLYKGVCYPNTDIPSQTYLQEVISQTEGHVVDYFDVWGGDLSSTVAIVMRRFTADGFVDRYFEMPLYQCGFDAPFSLQSEYFGLMLSFLVVVWAASHLYRKFWGQHDPI